MHRRRAQYVSGAGEQSQIVFLHLQFPIRRIDNAQWKLIQNAIGRKENTALSSESFFQWLPDHCVSICAGEFRFLLSLESARLHRVLKLRDGVAFNLFFVAEKNILRLILALARHHKSDVVALFGPDRKSTRLNS